MNVDWTMNDLIIPMKILRGIDNEDLGKLSEVGIKALASTLFSSWIIASGRTQLDVVKVLISMLNVESKHVGELEPDDGE